MSVATPPNSDQITLTEGRRASSRHGNQIGELPVGNSQKAIRIAMALTMAGTVYLVAQALPPGDAVLTTASPDAAVQTSDAQVAVPAAGDGGLADTGQDLTVSAPAQPGTPSTPTDPALATAPSIAAETNTTPAQAPAPDASAVQQVLLLTNQYRAEGGCGELTLDPKLSQAAQAHSDDMAAQGYFDHTGLDGRLPWDRAAAAGTTALAENIARGQPTAENVVVGWMNSPEHQANIMNCNLTRLGVGVAPNGNYWTQLFG